MTTTTTELVSNYLDVTPLAVASFLARYHEPTLTAYIRDLKTFLGWCQRRDVESLRAARSSWRSTCRTWRAAGTPRGPSPGGRRHPAEGRLGRAQAHRAAPAGVRRRAGRRPNLGADDHALPCLLGMLGLRVSEACAADITGLRYEAGYELLHVTGQGAKRADIPLRIRVLRPVREAIDGRAAEPILRTWTGRWLGRTRASRALTRVARAAGIC